MLKKLVLAFIILVVIFSGYTVFSADNTAKVYSVVNTGELPVKSNVNKKFCIYRANDSEVLADGLGGKQYGDNYVTFRTNDTNETYIDYNLSNSDFVCRYAVYSFSIYGNTSGLKFIARYSSSIQPRLADISKNDLMPDRWNNVQFVFDTETLDTYYLLNDVMYTGANLGEALKGTSYENNELMKVFRILFVAKNVITSYDDFSCYVSDIAPASFEYASITEENGDINIGHVITGGDKPVRFTSGYNHKVLKNGSSEWTDEDAVSVGDVIAVEMPYFSGTTEYYKTYRYITCVAPDIKVDFTKQSDMSFFQGGKPVGSDGKTLADTRYRKENIFGSGMSMEFVGVGINDSESVQSYYYTEWKKAKNYTEKYLVFEADFAFALKSGKVVPSTYITLSTNRGNRLGTKITGSANTYRVNHYVWVYNITKGTYDEYLNGVSISRDQPVFEKFKNGSSTSVRFVINGKYEPDNTNKNTIYSGYVDNIRMYECNNTPDILQPLKAPGEKFSHLPITKKSITVSEIKAMFPKDSKVSVYANRDYISITDDSTTVSAGSGVVVTEKDGIFNYIRLTLAPSDNPSYAVETLQLPSNGEIKINLVNYGEKRNMTFYLAKYDKNKSLVSLTPVSKEIDSGGTVSLSVGADASQYSAKLFAMDSLSSLRPIDKAIVLK